MLDGNELAPASHAIARLHLDAPIFAFAGDRLILRDSAERATLAGGTVLDPNPGHRPLRHAAQRRFLERLAVDHIQPLEIVAAWLERDRAVARTALLQKSSFSSAQISEAISQLMISDRATVVGGFVLDAVWWRGRLQNAADFIDHWHQ